MEQSNYNYLEPTKKFIIPLLMGSIIGALTDMIALSDKPNPNTSSFSIGFFIIIPVTVLILLLIFNFFKIKSRVLIIIVTTLSFFFAMIFGFWFYNTRVGYISDMYGLFYFLGAIPSLIIGLLFGIYLARQFKKSVGI